MTTSRRRFLAGAAGMAYVTVRGRLPSRAFGGEPRRVTGADFSSGVAAGDPSQTGAVLWTRLEGLDGDASLDLEVARDPGFANVVAAEPVVALADANFTARAIVDGLKPGEEYWYRFATGDADSPVGRFRTLRPPDSREPVRIAFWSCQSWKAGYYAAHRDIARQDVDLVVGLGDYIYEATGDTGPRTDDIGPDQSAQTLDEYRQKYVLYKSDPDLQAMHAAHAYVGTWDDHEVESSYYGLHGGNVQGRTRRVPFPQRRANGYRAFFEHMPFRRFADDPDRVYRGVRPNRHCELLLMDLHQYADPLPCPNDPTEGPIPLLPCTERHRRGRSLLGDRQRAWLEGRLAGSDARWKLLGNSMMMMGFYYGPDLPFNLSQWDGWAAERAHLARFILDRGIENVAAFTGDIHTFFAGYVTTTGDVTGRRALTEFIGSSVSSPGIPEGLENSIGVHSPLFPLITERVGLIDPHIVFNEMRHRGYQLVEASRDGLHVTFRGVRDALVPDSPVFTVARFTVPAGERRIERA